MKFNARQLIGPAMAFVLFALAVRLLYASFDREAFLAGLRAVPLEYVFVATFLVALNYILLASYDLLALRYVCRALPLRRVALVSFIGYALGNNLGTLLAAAPIRYRFYHRWGLTHRQIVALMSVLALTFWSGVCVLGGFVLVIEPIDLPAEVRLPFGTRTLGVILLSIAGLYGFVCVVWHRPIMIGGVAMRPPTLGLATAQASIAAVDLTISATALYLVLPANAEVPFSNVLAAYLVGITVSLVSQVPGGAGVLELILIYLIAGPEAELLASVLIFRGIYYVLPLIVGMITLVAHEIYAGTIEARHDDMRASSGVDVPED
ncbi:MAG: YbhN family protein [Planctomycetota bacterium]